MADHPARTDDAPEPGLAVAETHISSVFFTTDRAYKLLKPVRMPFVDLSDRANRLRAAERELELNRRIAPDVYLGLADVREGDELVDHMIVMRRLPAARRLASLVDDPRFSSCLRSVARTVAAFHAGVPPVDPAPMATRDAVAVNWDDNFDAIEPSVGSVIDPDEFATVGRLARAYLGGRDELFGQRIAGGFVRDGHGDLLAEDIFCLDDGPRIIDCLAFDEDYRVGDVLADIAFLVMDVDRLAGWAAARDLLGWYREFSDEHHPSTLAHHYVAYRAHVRAKVACLRHRQGDEASAELARRLHRLAVEHLQRARVRLVLVGGGPGVGKTVLAEGLAEAVDATALSTDEIRKDLTGTPRQEHRFAAPGAGIYDEGTTDAAYDELIRRAGLLLAGGQSVVLDASWTRERHRAAAREVASRHAAELVELECVLDPEVAKERIARRLSNPWNPSDATPDVVDHLLAAREPWPTAVAVDTSEPPDRAVARATAQVTRRHDPDGVPR